MTVNGLGFRVWGFGGESVFVGLGFGVWGLGGESVFVGLGFGVWGLGGESVFVTRLGPSGYFRYKHHKSSNSDPIPYALESSNNDLYPHSIP